MDYPIIVFMDDKDTYRVLIPDFEELSFTCNDMNEAYSTAKHNIENHLKKLTRRGRHAPTASQRECYVTQYLNAVLVSKVTISTSE